MFDYLIVGAGLFGSVFAHEMHKIGKKCLIIDKRNHTGGNCYSERISGIECHRYGPHLFHTKDKKIWKYINEIVEFNSFHNHVKCRVKNKIFSFPINLLTVNQLWGVSTPKEAVQLIAKKVIPVENASNMEEWIVGQVGKELYELFYKGYTTKQWGKGPRDIPVSVVKRIPIRMTFNDDYYYDEFQGLPIGGYGKIFDVLLKDIEVIKNADFFEDRDLWRSKALVTVFTGKIDEFYDYRFGDLEYRTLDFKTEEIDGDFQGSTFINYCDVDIPWTRIIEHKHFDHGFPFCGKNTVITYETPRNSNRNDIPYYPVCDKENLRKYEMYLGIKSDNIIFGGRTGSFEYLDMDVTIKKSLELVEKLK